MDRGVLFTQTADLARACADHAKLMALDTPNWRPSSNGSLPAWATMSTTDWRRTKTER
jgi:hypothetical protein